MNTPDKQALLIALRRKDRLIKSDPLVYYRPHNGNGRGGQDAFHRSVAKVRATITGNRWGKTTCGAAEDAAWLRGERVWYPKTDPARTSGIPKRRVKGLVIVTDWDICHETWTKEGGAIPGKLWEVVPGSQIKTTRRNNAGVVAYLEHVSGSELFFDTVKSFASNPQGAESKDWDFIHVDEPCPQAMFAAHARGLMDRHGCAWFNLTALREPWIIDYCEENGWVYYGATDENPTITADAIADLKKLLTPDEIECRINGMPLHLAGLVYKQFDASRHVLTDPPRGWSDLLTPPKEYTLYCRIDPHPQQPHAVLFCAVSPLGFRHYYREIFRKCTVDDLCREIREITKGRNVYSYKIDPIAWVPDPTTKRNAAQAFRDNGIPIVRAHKDLQGGILCVNMALARKEPTEVYFHSTCQRTLWEIKRYCWDQDNPNHPVDENDHMMENLYRTEIDRPKWVDPGEYPNRVEEIEIPSTDLSMPSLGYMDTQMENDAALLTLE